MYAQVPAASLITMGITLIMSVAIPAALFISLKKLFKAKPVAFFTGCGVFFVFAATLESIINMLIFTSPAGERIMGNTALYALFGGLMAGLFEETGRFIAFKSILKRNRDDDSTALMYGAGHGGFEMLFILGAAMASNFYFALMINSGTTAAVTSTVSGEELRQLEQTFTTLATAKPAGFLAGIVERIPAIALHMAFSVLVWTACKNRKYWWLFPAAIVLHTLVDMISGYMSLAGVSVVLIELTVYALSVLCVVLTVFISRKTGFQIKKAK